MVSLPFSGLRARLVLLVLVAVLYVAVGVSPEEAHAEANRRLLRTLAAVGMAGLLSVFAASSAGDLFPAPGRNAIA